MGGVASLAAAAMGAGKRLAGVAAICVGEQPSRGFESAVGGAMLKLRRDYVDGAPLEKLLSESDTLLDSLRSLAPLPVLMIAAQQDVLVPVERVQALAARIAPHGALQIVESSHLEAPDRSRTALLKWLETLES